MPDHRTCRPSRWLLDNLPASWVMSHVRLDDGTVRLTDLTERQLGLALAVHEGLSNKEIAARMGWTEGATKQHVSNLFTRTRIPAGQVREGRRLLLALWVERQLSQMIRQ